MTTLISVKKLFHKLSGRPGQRFRRIDNSMWLN